VLFQLGPVFKICIMLFTVSVNGISLYCFITYCSLIYIHIGRFPWCNIKSLLRHKLDVVMREFQEHTPVDCQTPCPNVDNVKFEDMHKRLLDALDQFTGSVNVNGPPVIGLHVDVSACVNVKILCRVHVCKLFN